MLPPASDRAGGLTLHHARRPRALALALLILAATLLPLTAARSGPLPCPEFEIVPRQGPSCPVPGGWEVLLPDGSRLLTHGPDAAPAAEPEGDLAVAATSPSRPPACVADPSTQYHNLLIYAVPSDGADRHASLADDLRSLVNQTNARLNAEAALFGETMSYRFACGDDGLILVERARLPTPLANASFSNIVGDLQALGYDGSLAKHWVWYDGDMGGIGGQANVHDDDRLILNNHNNFGGDYAVTYGHFSTRVMMHESGHNLGAVQLRAPDSSGRWHCNDGKDVMCYADHEGSTYSIECGDREWFDCNHDSYFHPFPPEGSWLASHWNLAHRHNRFVDFSNLPPAAPVVSCPTLAPAVDAEIRCTARVEDESEGVALTIDWGDGTVERVPAEGFAPPGLLSVSHAWRTVGRFNATFTASDDGDPPLTGPSTILAFSVHCGFSRSASLLLGLQGLEVDGVSARTEAGTHAACGGRPYALTGTAGSLWRVCWRDAAGADLACRDGASGVVPEGAAAARVVLLHGASSRYVLRVG